MWISKIEQWDKSHTDLSKYFIERIKQRVDSTEIISNKHKTSNGFTFIAEIVSVAENSLKRERSINRLVSLLDEATHKKLPFSIINDYIISKHFPEIAEYYLGINRNSVRDNKGLIQSIIIRSNIFLKRLQNGYYEKIAEEIREIDFTSDDFLRNSEKIDHLIDCLVPFLLFNGYSITSIDEISFRYVFKKNGKYSARNIVKNFDGKTNEFKILVRYWKESKEMNGIVSYLEQSKVEFKFVTFDQVKGDLKKIKDFALKEDEELLEIKHADIDPHNFIREIYDKGLKTYVQSADRLDLSYFTNFLGNVYWRFSKTIGEKTHSYNSTNIDLDPINVPNRGSTLRYTLAKYTYEWEKPYLETEKLPYIEELAQATYFYNLALGSKSIENSLFLLWTSLETLVPYRLHKSDIDNVQHFVATSLGFGAISRELASFIVRLTETNKLNSNCFKEFDIKTLYFNHSVSSLSKWAQWLSKKPGKGDKDPYEKIKPVSNLLCKEFCRLNDIYSGTHSIHKTAKYFLDKIETSEFAIKHQLDRIYLHRNQIVHSGMFLTEYSNLWSHLEWYCGKLLAYAYLRFLSNNEAGLKVEQIFMELETDSQLIKSILRNHSDKPIKDLDKFYHIIYNHSWQSF